MLQRRSRRSLALKGSTNKDLSHTANASSRRASLDKAQSRKALGSQETLDTHQTLQGNGVADSHQKPTGTAMNPLADVETGQMHHDTAVNGTEGGKPTSNSGVWTYLYIVFSAKYCRLGLAISLEPMLMLSCSDSHSGMR